MLDVQNLSKSYETARGALPILENVTFQMQAGDALAVVGPSGSGKSTLLYLLGALERPSAGAVSLDGVDPFSLPEPELAAFRNRRVGFVFQDHCLLPQCTVIENVLVPTLVAPRSDAYGARARDLLDRVGLGPRLDHLPGELSGGEKQRAALARALILEPALLLCDEPTGNLDQDTARAIADLLVDLHGRRRGILIVVTHSLELAARLPRQARLRGHRLAFSAS